ncbi:MULTISPECIES: hypothetical protein [Paenibacillus]|uniref:hypothetical protein n=1 Tax=Paenibacillus TaxID=44249 RepID=UPI0022B86A5F|nr:hypothetical protein [Paenibacillus caseinilyticus]MCZ8522821.1 hypothetical protein [Paenibacillus caseinilyticus]
MSCPKCPTRRVVDPPRTVYRDFYHPQIVEVIHNVEIVNRHHCVPVPCHIVTYTVRDEFCPSPVIPGVEATVSQVPKKKAKRK